jgi:hypothetical protein
MYQTRMMNALASSAVRREIPWLVAVVISAVALVALAYGYFA